MYNTLAAAAALTIVIHAAEHGPLALAAAAVLLLGMAINELRHRDH